MTHNANTNTNNLSEECKGDSDLVFHGEHYQSIDQVREQTEPGEILEFQRGPYTHFALYLGQGKVMNIEIADFRETKAQIVERTLEEVCHENKVRIRNHELVAQQLFQLNPRPTNEIIQKAISFRDQMVPYEFDYHNSEYYCTLWRYGRGFITEVAKQSAVAVESASLEDTKYKHH